jgi:hypothetical protein
MKVILNSDTIEAVYISETQNAWKVNCEGDIEWFPKSQVNYDKEAEEMEAPIWLLKTKFPDEY